MNEYSYENNKVFSVGVRDCDMDIVPVKLMEKNESPVNACIVFCKK